MLPSLYQIGDIRHPRSDEPGVVDDTLAVYVTHIGNDQRRRPDAARQIPPTRRTAAKHQGIGIPEHGVDIQQRIRGIDQRPQFPGPVQLNGMTRTVQHRFIPYPVQILIYEARRRRMGRIEPIIGSNIYEHERNTTH